MKGGQPGRPSDVWKFKLDEGGHIDLEKMSQEVIMPDEVLVSESCGGGGYGDPLERDPERVRKDAREGYVTVAKARDIYGVILDTEPEHYAVDYRATEILRSEMLGRGRGNELQDFG